MSEPDESVEPEEIREELFRALCERTDDLMVQSRIRAAVVELRLQEGVSERPLRGYRAKDPLLDLLLRLLGVGDDVAETQLRDPLDVAAERAAWVATRPVPVDPEASEGPEPEVLPNYVVMAEAERTDEHIVIGWQPSEDELEAFVRDLEAVVNDPPPPLNMPEDKLSAMVSFHQADAVERAQEDERVQALGAYAGPRYPSVAGVPLPDEAEDREAEDGDAEDREASDRAVDTGLESSEEALESASAVLPDSSRPETPPEPASEVGASPPSPAETNTPPSAVRESFAQADRQRMERERERLAEASAVKPGATPPVLPPQVMALGLAGLALILVLLFAGSIYMGGQRMQAGQQRAEVTRAKLYAAIALDDNLVRDMGDLGADGRMLQQRYQQFVIAKEPEKARRALTLSRSLEEQMKNTRSGSVRARQLEQVVQHISSARTTYTYSVEEWAASTQGFFGGAAIAFGFGVPPESNAILPFE